MLSHTKKHIRTTSVISLSNGIEKSWVVCQFILLLFWCWFSSFKEESLRWSEVDWIMIITMSDIEFFKATCIRLIGGWVSRTLLVVIVNIDCTAPFLVVITLGIFHYYMRISNLMSHWHIVEIRIIWLLFSMTIAPTPIFNWTPLY